LGRISAGVLGLFNNAAAREMVWKMQDEKVEKECRGRKYL